MKKFITIASLFIASKSISQNQIVYTDTAWYDTYSLDVITPKSYTFYYTEAIFRQKSFDLFRKVYPAKTR